MAYLWLGYPQLDNGYIPIMMVGWWWLMVVLWLRRRRIWRRRCSRDGSWARYHAKLHAISQV